MKEQKSKQRGRKEPRWQLFEPTNYRLLLAGVIVIIVGYVFMMQGPHNSFWSLHLAPIVLVVGYCVLIPLAILLRSHGRKSD